MPAVADTLDKSANRRESLIVFILCVAAGLIAYFLADFLCRHLLDFFGERIDFYGIFPLTLLWGRIISPSLIAFLVPTCIYYRYSKNRSHSLTCGVIGGAISIISFFTVY
jgi:uncharacterized BrkB/YihY/UPF0761 family membrane protein